MAYVNSFGSLGAVAVQSTSVAQENARRLSAYNQQLAAVRKSNAAVQQSYAMNLSHWTATTAAARDAYKAAVNTWNQKNSAYLSSLASQQARDAEVKRIGDNFNGLVRAAATAAGVDPNQVGLKFGSTAICTDAATKAFFASSCATSTQLKGLGAIVPLTKAQLQAAFPGVPCFLKNIPACVAIPPALPLAPAPGPKPTSPVTPPKPVMSALQPEPKPPVLLAEPGKPTATVMKPIATALPPPVQVSPSLPPPVTATPKTTTQAVPPNVVVIPETPEEVLAPPPTESVSKKAGVVGILALVVLVGGGGYAAYHLLRKPKAR